MSLIRRVFILLSAALAPSVSVAQIAWVGTSQASNPGQAAISFVANQQTSGNSASTTVTRPGADVSGRLMIAQVVLRGSVSSASITAPSGWTLLIHTASTAVTQAVYWKRMTGSEPANYTWSWGATRRFVVGLASYDNVDTNGDPVDAFSANVTASSATITMTGVTTIATDSWIVGLAASARASNHSTPAGMTERYDQNSGGGVNGVTASHSTEPVPSAGATGNRTSTIAAGAANNIGHLIAIRPAGSTLLIARPPGTAAGHVMIASIAARPCSATSGGACTTTITPPSGWTLVNTVTDQTTGGGTGGYGSRLFVYRRVAATPITSEPTEYLWRFGGTPVSNGAVGGILSFSGVDTSSPIVAEAGQTTASSTSHTAPGVDTGTVTNTMLVSTHSANSSATWTPPGGMTERVDGASLVPPDDLGIALEINTEPRPAAGPTGTRTATWSAPPAADTGITHMLALRPVLVVDHYAISYPGGATGVTCDPHEVTITAHDTAHDPVAPPAGTVLTLNTSTGSGVWTTLVSGSGTWSPSGSNDGVATYTWPGGQASFTVRLRHNTPVTLSINLTDSNGKTEGTGSDDPSLTFANAAFRVTDSGGASVATFGTHIAGKRSDTGFGAQTRFLQAIRTDTATGSCVGIFQSKTVTVQMAGARINPTGGSSQVEVLNNVSSFVAVATSAGAPPGSYTNVTLDFDAQSKAPLVFRYPDAGQIQIFARYELPSPPSGTFVEGSSNQFVVRPFGLRISGVTTSSSPSPSDAAPYIAGQNFNVTLTAVAWKTGDDTDANGVPDSEAQIATNAATPNFGLETTPATAALTHTLNAPSGGNPGTLGGATTFSGFSGGSRTQAVNWSEVGFINLFATSSNYLGSGQNVTNSAAGLTGVGRFRPSHFAVSGAGLTNRAAAGCSPASSFTYLGERLDLAFTLSARNTADVVTQNYTGAYAKLGLGTFSAFNLGARSGSTGLTPRIDPGSSASGSWASGSASVTLQTAVRRASPDNPDGPFAATQFGIAPVDSDSVAMNTLDLDADVNGTPERKNLGVSAELRFGRLRMQNAYGSEKLPLPVPIRTEYWNGTNFVRNAADGCTAIPRSAIALDFSPPSSLVACETAITTATVTFAAGEGALTLAAPGAANTGTVLLTPQLRSPPAGTYCPSVGGAPTATTSAALSYLLGRWNDSADPDSDPSTNYDDNPAGRAGFGLYGAQPRNFIFFRENY